jgi:hypothetical protein
MPHADGDGWSYQVALISKALGKPADAYMLAPTTSSPDPAMSMPRRSGALSHRPIRHRGMPAHTFDLSQSHYAIGISL